MAKYISSGLEQKRATLMAYLDISKAFDKVWHEALIAKMSRMDLLRRLDKIKRSFLKDTKFQVILEGLLPSTKEIL